MSEQRKYRPSNGTEGMIFDDKFCDRCLRRCGDPIDLEDGMCGIYIFASLFDVDDDRYPDEWRYDKNGIPTCTAFSPWDWDQFPDGPPAPIAPFIDPNQTIIMFPE